jgi:hypothetical protein
MRIGSGQTLTTLIVAGCILLVTNAGNLVAQSEKAARKAGIVSISASSIATVQIEVHAADKELVIPYCKKTGAEENLLYCNQGLEHNFEHFDGTKWIRTMPGYPGEVFGVDIDAWKPAIIPPGGSTTFEYRFNPDFFHLRKGEKIRLIIYAWESPESLANNEKPVSKFVSPVFVCP